MTKRSKLNLFIIILLVLITIYFYFNLNYYDRFLLKPSPQEQKE